MFFHTCSDKSRRKKCVSTRRISTRADSHVYVRLTNFTVVSRVNSFESLKLPGWIGAFKSSQHTNGRTRWRFKCWNAFEFHHGPVAMPLSTCVINVPPNIRHIPPRRNSIFELKRATGDFLCFCQKKKKKNHILKVIKLSLRWNSSGQRLWQPEFFQYFFNNSQRQIKRKRKRNIKIDGRKMIDFRKRISTRNREKYINFHAFHR